MKAVYFLFFTWCIGAFSVATAQSTTGTLLTGKVLNEKGHAVEFAAVLLVRPTDTTAVVQATLTDTLGGFTLARVQPGEYVIKAAIVGSRTTRSAPVAVQLAVASLSVGTMTLVSSSKVLGEVVVQGERPMAERNLGKLTLNVSHSFFKTATNALEVLRRAPGVQVSPVGGITLNGTIAPVVYVDGRQLPLTSDELQGLSKDDVEQVEIASNASARYDGETRAVINIKLKRDKALGLKGSAYTGASLNRQYAGYEGGISSTYKTKRAVYYARVGFAELNNFLRGDSKRIVQTSSARTEFDDASFIHTQFRPLSYQIVADYSVTKNQTVGILIKGLGRPGRETTANTTQVSAYDTDRLVSAYLLSSTTLTNSHLDNAAIDLNYRGVLNSKGDELLAYADYAHFSILQDQDFRTTFPSAASNALRFPSVLRGHFPTNTHISSLRADYNHSVNTAIKTSVGTKISHTKTDNELRYDTVTTDKTYVRDLSRSNRFLYEETIMAAYGGVSIERGQNSLDAALRVEYTHSTGNSLTLDNTVQRNYYRWLPSLQAQHKFDKQNAIAFTFARKMRRPSFYDLNPFQFYISPYEYNQGNPFLLPATITTAELRYTHKSLSLTAGYELIRDQISQLPVQNEQTKVIYYTRTNLARVEDITLTATLPTVFTSWWKMQNTVVLLHTRTASDFNGGFINNQAWSTVANGQQTFTVPKGITLDLSYSYEAPTASQIYHVKSSGLISFNAQKLILKGKGSIQLSAVDLFNTYREAFYGQYNGIDVNTLQKRNVQQLSTRFTYRFGSSTFNRKGKTSGSAEEEGRANK